MNSGGAPSSLDTTSASWAQQLTLSQKMHDLRSSPQVQAVTTTKMAQLEQGMDINLKHKKSGRANIQDPMEPNENFPIGENGRRPTFDELNQFQCTQGFMTNVIQVAFPHMKNAMLAEYIEILETANTGG